MQQRDARKLLFGALFVGASALPAGTIVSDLLISIGGNWLAEVVGGVISAGPPPSGALTRTFAKSVELAITKIRVEYGAERVSHDSADAFELLRQTGRSITEVTLPSGTNNIAHFQSTIVGSLSEVLYGFPDSQIRIIQQRLLTLTAHSFHEELAREPEAWRLYHSWLLEHLTTENASILTALVAHPVAHHALTDPSALANRIGNYTSHLDEMLLTLEGKLQSASGAEIIIDQSAQEGGVSHGAFNQFGTGHASPPKPGKIHVNQSKQTGGVNYGAFNYFGNNIPLDMNCTLDVDKE